MAGISLRFPVANASSSGSGGSATLNVFCQNNEPEVKEGVWIKNSKAYNKIVTVGSVYGVGGTMADMQTEQPNLYGKNLYSASFIGMKDNIAYFLNSERYTNYATYNLTTGVYTKASEVASSVVHYDGDYIIAGNYIYRFGGYVSSSDEIVNYGYRYSLTNPSSTSPTKLNTLPNSLRFGYRCHLMYDETKNCIFIYGTFKDSNFNDLFGGLFKYDIATDRYTQIVAPTSSGFGGYSGAAVLIGDYVYSFGGSGSGNKAYDSRTRKMNIETGAVTTLAANSQVSDGTFNTMVAIAIGGYVYIMNTTVNKIFCYDIVKNTYTTTSNTINTTYTRYSRPFIYNDQIYFNSYNLFNIGMKTFAEGDFIIERVDLATGKYKTQFFGNSTYGEEFGRICSGFEDAWLYTNGDFDTTSPAYYGDGTKWVKFKN